MCIRFAAVLDVCGLVSGHGCLAGWARAQESGARDRIYAVTHVDIVPTDAAAGTKLVHQYVLESRKDKGAVRVEAYIQVSRINHLTLVEVWENRQALEAHEAAAHTKKFREQIDPCWVALTMSACTPSRNEPDFPCAQMRER